jgi:hypothetical protein
LQVDESWLLKQIKTTENEVFWTDKTPGRFGEENHGQVYTRKEKDQKGDEFRI